MCSVTKKLFCPTENCVVTCRNIKSAYFGKNKVREVIFCIGLTTFKTNFIVLFSYLAFVFNFSCLCALQKKFFSKDIGTQEPNCKTSCIILSQRGEKKFTHHSILPRDFARSTNIGLFLGFGRQMSLPNYEKLNNRRYILHILTHPIVRCTQY